MSKVAYFGSEQSYSRDTPTVNLAWIFSDPYHGLTVPFPPPSPLLSQLQPYMLAEGPLSALYPGKACSLAKLYSVLSWSLFLG